MPITPCTRLAWYNLANWMQVAHQLDRRRSSSKRNNDIDSHWDALPDGFIETAPIETLAEFISMINGSANLAWTPPQRGHRRNTKWERLNVAARNLHWRLTRDQDHASMGFGDNSQGNGENAKLANLKTQGI